MEKKQSSLDYLIEQLFKTRNNSTEVKETNSESIIQQAKQMHKEEILIAYSKALPITDGVFTAIDKAHDYYNETFGGEQC